MKLRCWGSRAACVAVVSAAVVGAPPACRRADDSAASQPVAQPGAASIPADRAGAERVEVKESPTAEVQTPLHIDLGEITQRVRRSVPFGRLLDEVELAKHLGPRGAAIPGDQAGYEGGYTFFVRIESGSAVLIDQEGEIKHEWRAEGDERVIWNAATLLENGDIAVSGARRVGANRRRILDEDRFAARIAWDGQVRWEFPLTGRAGLAPLSDGRLATVAFKATAARFVQSDVVVLSADGSVIESLSLNEAIAKGPGRFAVDVLANRGRRGGDPLMVMSVERVVGPIAKGDVRFAPDDIVVSLREAKRVAVLNLRRRELAWSWGAGELVAPSYARVVGGGNVLVVDSDPNTDSSRVLEVDPVERRIVWSYRPRIPTKFFAPLHGAAQRLSNGNTLLVNPRAGEIVELTTDGQVVWGYAAFEDPASMTPAQIAYAQRPDTALIERLLEPHQEAGRRADDPP